MEEIDMTQYRSHNDLPSNTKVVSIDILNARLVDAIYLALLTAQAHWNVKGPNFIALHEMIDRFRTELDSHVDTMAERVVRGGRCAEERTRSRGRGGRSRSVHFIGVMRR